MSGFGPFGWYVLYNLKYFWLNFGAFFTIFIFFHKATLLCVLKRREKTAGESEVLPVVVLGSPMDVFKVFDDFTLASNILKLNESLPLFRVSSIVTASKLSKYGVISGPYFPVFSPNTGKYGPEITPYLDTFHAVNHMQKPFLWTKGTKRLRNSLII